MDCAQRLPMRPGTERYPPGPAPSPGPIRRRQTVCKRKHNAIYSGATLLMHPLTPAQERWPGTRVGPACASRESNSDGLPHGILSPARLPIPPPAQEATEPMLASALPPIPAAHAYHMADQTQSCRCSPGTGAPEKNAADHCFACLVRSKPMRARLQNGALVCSIHRKQPWPAPGTSIVPVAST